MKYASFEHGMLLRNQGNIDAAWNVLYKVLIQLEYLLTSEENPSLRKEQFDCLYEIGLIQQEKYHHEAANRTFEKAEQIRLTYLADLNLSPIQQVGLPKWQSELDMMAQLERDEQYYALVDVGKRVIDEIESLDYSLQTRDHWRILWQTSEKLYRAYIAIDEPEKAEMYNDKAEDLAFMHDFDRFSSFEE